MQETTKLCARCAACDFASKRVWEANSDEVNELVADIIEEMKQHEIDVTYENVEETCLRRKYSTETRQKVYDNFTIGFIPSLPSQEMENPSTMPDCPLCILMFLAYKGGPLGLSNPWYHDSGAWSGVRAGFNVGRLGTYLSFLEDNGSTPWLRKRGRVIEKSQINPDLISKWMHSCETVHGSKCAPLPLQVGHGFDLKVFRLIDVSNNCVIEIANSDKQYRYFALSYIWGCAEQVRLLTTNKHILMRPGGLQHPKLANVLPKTIRDAMDLVRVTGGQYLWVDSLCLLQDDPNDMAYNIPFMDIIYRGAFATIISASGADANSGLPGFRRGSRQATQHGQEVVPGVRMVILRELDEYLQASKYATRGWTFQEDLLSSRSIIFFDERVYFRCRRCTWCEDNNQDESPEDEIPHASSSSLLPLVLDSDTPPFFTFQISIMYYSSRNLTHASDAIDAFAGILRYFETRLNSPMLYGLPVFSLDISLLFFGMELKRRPEFPSYSWAGWTGRIHWSRMPEWNDENPPERSEPVANEWLNTRSWIVWYQRQIDGQIEPLLENTEALDVPKGHIGYRHRHHPWLTGMNVTPTTDFHYSSPHYTLLQFWTYSAYFQLAVSDGPSFKGNMHIVDSEGEICGKAFIHEVETLRTESAVELLILSECTISLGDPWDEPEDISAHMANWKYYWIMIISWESGIASRRGIGTLDRDAINRGHPPGLIWKEILLG